MKKKASFGALTLLAFLLSAGISRAAAVTVDFSGVSTTDITMQNNPSGWMGFDLDIINFQFDNLGGGSQAWITPGGVTAALDPANPGVLDLSFSMPILWVSFDYTLYGTSSAVDPGAVGLFYSHGSFQDFRSSAAAFDPINGIATGNLVYGGPFFDQAAFIFSTQATAVTLGNLQYSQTPEPGTCMLLGSVLLLAGFASRRYVR